MSILTKNRKKIRIQKNEKPPSYIRKTGIYRSKSTKQIFHYFSGNHPYYTTKKATEKATERVTEILIKRQQTNLMTQKMMKTKKTKKVTEIVWDMNIQIQMKMTTTMKKMKSKTKTKSMTCGKTWPSLLLITMSLTILLMHS